VHVQKITRLKTYTCFIYLFIYLSHMHAQTIKLQNYVVFANYKAQSWQTTECINEV